MGHIGMVDVYMLNAGYSIERIWMHRLHTTEPLR